MFNGFEPNILFNGWSVFEFKEWLQTYGIDRTIEEHIASVEITLDRLVQGELYEFAAITRDYLKELKCAHVQSI